MALSHGLRITLLGGLAIAGVVVMAVWYVRSPGGSPGGWPAEERRAFLDSCNKQCRSSPGVTPDRYPHCDKACVCGADEAERTVSYGELGRLVVAQKTGVSTHEQDEKMQRIAAASLACVGGTPGGKK
jgi:hypothetical protein